jgi:hypothetical protein
MCPDDVGGFFLTNAPRKAAHFQSSKRPISMHQNACPDRHLGRGLIGDLEQHLKAQSAKRPSNARAQLMSSRNRTLRHIIVRERWRTSRFPSVPSALRDLDMRHALPLDQHLPERPAAWRRMMSA